MPRLASLAHRFIRPPGRLTLQAALAIVATALFGTAALGSIVTFNETGTSTTGTPLRMQAVLSGSGTTLTIDLFNTGPASSTSADILTSLYFTIVDPTTGLRPVLSYASGFGQAYQVTKSGQDIPVSWAPQKLTGSSSLPSNLVANVEGDQGWQFKTFSPPLTLGFGIGTAGNSNLKKQGLNFDGGVVSGIDQGRTMINLGVYSNGGGENSIVATDGIVDSFLVRNHATFTFRLTGGVSSLTPFDASWVRGNVMFGFGTGPDQVFLPEPSSSWMALAGAAGIFFRRRLRAARVLAQG